MKTDKQPDQQTPISVPANEAATPGFRPNFENPLQRKPTPNGHPVPARAANNHGQVQGSPSRPNPKPVKFALTQLGNAERLVHLHGENIRWCTAWKSWLVWNGRRWRIDTNGAIDRMAHSTIREMAREAKKVQDLELQKAMRDYAKRSETKFNFEAMIDIAKDVEERISVTPQELDAHPMLLNCRNGVIDLQTGGLIRHRNSKKFLLTKEVRVEYNPAAQCRTWIRFLNRIFDGDSALIEYIQKIIGYSLTGAVSEKALFLFHGDGDNGKTTLLETIRHMMGEYAGLVELDALMLGSQDSARERAIADLHGKRFVTASESEAGQRFREATIKRLTGMGRLVGRRLYSNSFEFDPEFKLFIDANHKPQIKGTEGSDLDSYAVDPVHGHDTG
jgi:putative DNA primase/helicase